jgi:hypothetical protein
VVDSAFITDGDLSGVVVGSVGDKEGNADVGGNVFDGKRCGLEDVRGSGKAGD